MSLKHAASAGAIVSLCVAFAPAPAVAQPVNCAELYNHVMSVYQAAPLSPQYNQIAAAYSANCLAGASAAPAYPPIDPQDYGAYYQPPYSAYAEPDYPYSGGYGYAVPVGVGIGLGFGGRFHHGGDSRDHGGFRGAGFHDGGDPHRGGQSGGGHGGDRHEHH